MDRYDRLLIGGAWVRPSGAGTITVVNPTTEEPLAEVPAGSPADGDRAVWAARRAFDAWAAVPAVERGELVARIGKGLESRAAGIGATVAREVGTPLNLSCILQAGLPALTFGSMPDLVAAFPFEEEVGSSLVRREPAGVVVGLTPWNFPLHQVAAKVAPALTAGCTIVVKPSELAPLTAFLLAEVAQEVGLPDGVFNLVTGGPATGQALVAHPEVDVVSFTGSTATGRRVAALAAPAVKRVALELGG
ncbi:MAG: aldehyde dehydrogenase family protein, partial [Acidimicrobiales bacterium]